MITIPKKLPSFNFYYGGDLKGIYRIFRKLDGVCAYIDQEAKTVTIAEP